MRRLLRLLLVDDENIILRGLKETYDWEHMGFEIVGTALDGDIAVAMMDEIKPDVIITDISMKRMSGLELMENVRRMGFRTEFVVLSAYRDFAYAQSAIKNGALQYLIKPLDDDELGRVMGEVYQTCIEKMKLQEAYASWKKFLLEDKEKYFQAMTQKYLDDGISREELVKSCSGLGIEEYLKQQFVVVCADLEASYQIVHQADYHAKRHVLGIMLQQKLRDKFDVQFFQTADGIPVYLLFLENGEKRFIIQKILWEIEKELGNVIVSSISNCHSGVDGMKAAYEEALEIYGVAQEAGVSGLSLNEKIQLPERLHYSIDIENQILQSIRHEDEAQLKTACEKLVYMLSDEEMGKIYLHRMMVRLEFALAEAGQLTEPLRSSFDSFYMCQNRFQLARMVHLAYELMKEIVQKKKETVSQISETLFEDYIHQAVQYIDENLSEENLSVTHIAEQLHLNSAYFGRVFKKVYGTSIKKYILDKRIECAKSLLMEGKYSVTDVGAMVGIPNPSYFSRLFREKTGKMPSEY